MLCIWPNRPSGTPIKLFILSAMFCRCSLAALRMFAGFFLDVFRMLRWILWAWWNLMIISNESMHLNDPKEFDDPQLCNDPSYSML